MLGSLRFGSRGDREIFDSQNGQVCTGVASGDFRWKLAACAGLDNDIVVVTKRVLGGDDNARRPMYTARIKARAAVDGDDRRGGTLDQRPEFIRKRKQGTCHNNISSIS